MQEPFNPPPIPSPQGDVNPPSFIPPSGEAKVNFDVISRAWELLKPTIGTWIVACLIYGGATLFLSLITNMISGSGNPLPMPVPTGVPGEFQTPPPVMPNIPMLVIGNLVQFIISQFLMAGLYRMAINQARGEAPNLGTIFSTVDVLPALLGAALLTSLAVFAGAIFCVLPGLLLAGLYMFATPLVVDRRLGAIDAMSTSFNALKPQMWSALAFILVVGLLGGAGILLCGVGVLITAPLAILSIALLYRDFFPQPALA